MKYNNQAQGNTSFTDINRMTTVSKLTTDPAPKQLHKVSGPGALLRTVWS
jgi:hypothetical protein